MSNMNQYLFGVASQGDQGFPGEAGPQGERGVGEPGPKVRHKADSPDWTVTQKQTQ